MTQGGTWLQWTGIGWSDIEPPMLLDKTEAGELAKRVFNSVGWAYGVKIQENL